jgi:transcription elongation factor Elf1
MSQKLNEIDTIIFCHPFFVKTKIKNFIVNGIEFGFNTDTKINKHKIIHIESGFGLAHTNIKDNKKITFDTAETYVKNIFDEISMLQKIDHVLNCKSAIIDNLNKLLQIQFEEPTSVNSFIHMNIAHKHFITNFDEITQLKCNDLPITSLSFLKHFKNVETLECCNCELRNLNGIEFAPNLKYIDVSYNHYDDLLADENVQKIINTNNIFNGWFSPNDLALTEEINNIIKKIKNDTTKV